jgi:predicted phage terminase large subunit-like protein
LTNISLMERAAKAQGADKLYKSFTPKEWEELQYTWQAWARPNQLPPPGDWLVWLIVAGRGFGKTRSAAEFIRSEVEQGHAKNIALVGKTPADARDVMIEGESGLLSISPPHSKPLYEPSKRRLTWPNGAKALIYSSQEPDQLRGPQFDLAWGDEIRTWYYAQETWDNLLFGLRIGQHPRVVATTTPLPIALIKVLLKSPNVVVTRGTTYENRANLAPSFYAQIISRYEGTRLGRQEINAELLEDVPGALWQRTNILYKPAPDLQRVVVAIDPAVTSSEAADETGIIVVGKGVDGFYYVMADRSARLSPDGWARRAIQAYRDFRGDRIIGEVNNGGEMVELTLRTVDRNIPYKAVHASRGKVARAEPIAALFEQHKVFHIQPFDELEDQLVTWTPEVGKSPDRLDALVWALTELAPLEQEQQETIIVYDALQEVGLEMI